MECSKAKQKTARHLQKLQKLAHATQRCALSANEMQVGPPAVAPRKYFAQILTLQCAGLKSVLTNPDLITVDSPESFADIDFPEDLEKLATASSQAVRAF